MLFVTLPLLADSNSNWRSKVKEVPLEKRYGCTELHKLKNKIVFLGFFLFFRTLLKGQEQMGTFICFLNWSHLRLTTGREETLQFPGNL